MMKKDSKVDLSNLKIVTDKRTLQDCKKDFEFRIKSNQAKTYMLLALIEKRKYKIRTIQKLVETLKRKEKFGNTERNRHTISKWLRNYKKFTDEKSRGKSNYDPFLRLLVRHNKHNSGKNEVIPQNIRTEIRDKFEDSYREKRAKRNKKLIAAKELLDWVKKEHTDVDINYHTLYRHYKKLKDEFDFKNKLKNVTTNMDSKQNNNNSFYEELYYEEPIKIKS